MFLFLLEKMGSTESKSGSDPKTVIVVKVPDPRGGSTTKYRAPIIDFDAGSDDILKTGNT